MGRTVETLDTRQRNRALLARQHLLRRSTASLPAAARRHRPRRAGRRGAYARFRDDVETERRALEALVT